METRSLFPNVPKHSNWIQKCLQSLLEKEINTKNNEV